MIIVSGAQSGVIISGYIISLIIPNVPLHRPIFKLKL
jgi:hypothetical protein